MASTLHPVASLPKKSFRRVVIFAKRALSIRRWFSAAELAQLQRYSMEQANGWGKFGQLPKDQSIPFCANFAQELAAAYGGDSEWERDAACWASEMAKWESAVENPEYQLHRSHKDVEELFGGDVLSDLFTASSWVPRRPREVLEQRCEQAQLRGCRESSPNKRR